MYVVYVHVVFVCSFSLVGKVYTKREKSVFLRFRFTVLWGLLVWVGRSKQRVRAGVGGGDEQASVAPVGRRAGQQVHNRKSSEGDIVHSST